MAQTTRRGIDKGFKGISVTPEGGGRAHELRSMAARLLKLAEDEERLEVDRSPGNVASLQEFRRNAEQSKAQLQEASGKIAEGIHHLRQNRDRYFPKALFGEPAWDLLLELYSRRCCDERVTVSNACIASGVPQSTALRWIDILIDMGLAVREADVEDRRKIWLVMTEQGFGQMNAYLSDMFVRQDGESAFSL